MSKPTRRVGSHLRCRLVPIRKPHMIKFDPPRPRHRFGIAGEATSIFVSSSLNTRSPAAMADCKMLYFSLRS